MIWESSWKLSKLRVVDLGYIPEIKPVLFSNGEIAKLQNYTSDGGRFSWLVLNTDSFAWEETEYIDISEVVGVVVPSSINSIIVMEIVKGKEYYCGAKGAGIDAA